MLSTIDEDGLDDMYDDVGCNIPMDAAPHVLKHYPKTKQRIPFDSSTLPSLKHYAGHDLLSPLEPVWVVVAVYLLQEPLA